MPLNTTFMHSRSIWVYYALFFSGSLALAYQAYAWNIVGDSVNFLCLLFLLNGFFAKKTLHIIENTLLMTLGYILPLLIRNSLKLSYVEAPSMTEFFKLALISSTTTLLLGLVFSGMGYSIRQLTSRIKILGRGRINTRSISED